MYKMYEMELAGRTLRVDVDRVAKQANGAVLMHYGDTTVLCTSTASEKPRDGIDFFPLSVEYNERLYAVGKIPGGFNKREGKASENAILTDRVIDRPRTYGCFYKRKSDYDRSRSERSSGRPHDRSNFCST